MTGPALGSTPEDRVKLRQLGTAAQLLELVATRYGTPGYDQAAAEFERSHRAADLVFGLVLIADYFGRTASPCPERYLPMLSAWQRMAEIADAMTPAVDDEKMGG